MRVLLMHNPKAGKGEHEAEDLMALLAKAGHAATYQSTRKNNYETALEKSTDLVLIAGGDGTVGKVARCLVGRRIPMSVLPLGTANNLARTLGFHDSAENLIGHLEGGRRCNFDVGRAKGPWGERLFFEGAGAGLLPDYLRGMASQVKKQNRRRALSKKEETERHAAFLRRLLNDYAACEWQIHLDGKDVSGRHILLEAMNIRSVGPILTLAPNADTADGYFDFVVIGEAERPKLARYLELRLTNETTEFPVAGQRFRHLRMVWEESSLHFDDKLWPQKDESPSGPCEIEIMVEQGALEVLQPAKSSGK